MVEITTVTRKRNGHTARSHLDRVDSDVLLDIVTEDPEWSAWFQARLAEALDRDPVVINQVFYGEVAHRYPKPKDIN